MSYSQRIIGNLGQTHAMILPEWPTPGEVFLQEVHGTLGQRMLDLDRELTVHGVLDSKRGVPSFDSNELPDLLIHLSHLKSLSFNNTAFTKLQMTEPFIFLLVLLHSELQLRGIIREGSILLSLAPFVHNYLCSGLHDLQGKRKEKIKQC